MSISGVFNSVFEEPRLCRYSNGKSFQTGQIYFSDWINSGLDGKLPKIEPNWIPPKSIVLFEIVFEPVKLIWINNHSKIVFKYLSTCSIRIFSKTGRAVAARRPMLSPRSVEKRSYSWIVWIYVYLLNFIFDYFTLYTNSLTNNSAIWWQNNKYYSWFQ